MSVKKLLAAAGAVAAAAAYGYYQNNVFEVSEYSVEADIAHPIRLLCLADLHGKQFGRHNFKLIKAVRAQSPDMILLPGDTLSADCHSFDETLFTLKKLAAIAPCVLIAGNHEHRSGRWREISRKFTAAGVIVLENARWDGFINGVPVHILGLDEGIAASRLDYLRAALKTMKYVDNSKALSELSALKGVRIVLSHFPENFARIGELSYCRFGFDLMLCGHAHGGHWRLGHQGVYAPGQGLFPAFSNGLYGTGPRLFVSRGLGNDSPLPRINNRPEIAVITLGEKSAENDR